MKTGFLSSKRLVLRPLAETDADGPYPDWFNDEETCAGNSHHVFPYTHAQALEYIRSVQGSTSSLVLAITLRKDGRHVGNVSLQKINLLSGSAELAIVIGDAACRGKGIGREACQMIVRHGFRSLNLHRISCGTFASNTGMKKIAADLGFQEEGVLREAAFKDGRHLDVVLYGLLAANFPDR